MKNNITRFLLFPIVVGALIVFYYCYYSYYINLFNEEQSLLISRIGRASMLDLDTVANTTYLDLRVKLGSASIFLLVFGVGYSALVYTIYRSLESVKLVLGIYLSILCIGGIILLIALSINNHSFMYRAGAEIKNLVWSPLFMMLIVLAPYTPLFKEQITNSTNNQLNV